MATNTLKEASRVQTPTKEERKNITVQSIKEKAQKAAEMAKRNQNTKIIGNSTVVISYSYSKPTAVRERRNIKNFFLSQQENEKKK